MAELDIGRALAKLVREENVLPELRNLLNGSNGEAAALGLDEYADALRRLGAE